MEFTLQLCIVDKSRNMNLSLVKDLILYFIIPFVFYRQHTIAFYVDQNVLVNVLILYYVW